MNKESSNSIVGRLLQVYKAQVILWLLMIFAFSFTVKSQDSVVVTSSSTDTSIVQDFVPRRFVDMSDKLLISAGVLFKSYNIRIENVNSGTTIAIDPTGSANLGFGVNYRWLGIGFSFGLPASSKEEAEFGKTQKQDFQLNIYTNAFLVQGHLQHYKGFHVSELEKGDTVALQINDGNGLIPSLETYSVGLSSWYFFNHKKFSYKAAYLRNAIQTKSAGSPIIGIYYGLDNAEAHISIGESLPDSIKNQFDVLGYSSQSFGISAGYTYTWVIKKFFANATLVPGIGVKNVTFTTQKETFNINEGLTGRLVFNFSMGYEAKHFLVGMRVFTSSRIFEANGLRIGTSTNSVTLFVGKRFNVRKNKKK